MANKPPDREQPTDVGGMDEVPSHLCGDCGRAMSQVTQPRPGWPPIGWKCLFCASEKVKKQTGLPATMVHATPETLAKLAAKELGKKAKVGQLVSQVVANREVIVAIQERARCRGALCASCRDGAPYSRETRSHGQARQVQCDAAPLWELEHMAPTIQAGAMCEVKIRLAGQGVKDDIWALLFVEKVDDNFVTASPLFDKPGTKYPIASVRAVVRKI
jgi:hypothetical protein